MSCGAPRRLEANGLGFRLYEWSAPLLAEQFHVMALDLRGHGGSAWAEPPGYAFTDYVSDAIAILDALGWRSPLLIGHSMGGYVGALLASLHPQRVGALVIVDTLAEWSEEQEGWARRQLDRPSPRFTSREEAAERFRLTPPATTAPAEWVRHLGEAAVIALSPGRAALTSRRRPLMLGHRLRG